MYGVPIINFIEAGSWNSRVGFGFLDGVPLIRSWVALDFLGGLDLRFLDGVLGNFSAVVYGVQDLDLARICRGRFKAQWMRHGAFPSAHLEGHGGLASR